MITIRHRVNTIEELAATPSEHGVEIDLRDHDGRIVLQHDPLRGGEDFERYLHQYRHRFLIANVKCEGVEDEALRLLAARGIDEFFLLDLSFPAVIKLVRRGERRIALRWSEYEPLDGCLALAGRVQWIWVDCFSDFPPVADSDRPKLRQFRTCLVSPELQGRPAPPPDKVAELLQLYWPAAVCTKRPQAWATA